MKFGYVFIFLILMSITLVSPLKVNIPITSTNSSLLNINNSQYLEGHPASYFVPYTGATDNVDLGIKSIYASNFVPSGGGNLRLTSYYWDDYIFDPGVYVQQPIWLNFRPNDGDSETGTDNMFFMPTNAIPVDLGATGVVLGDGYAPFRNLYLSGTAYTANLTATGTIQAEHLKTTDDLEVTDDINMSSGSVINWNSGDVTLTHSSNKLSFYGGTIVSKGTWSGATNGFKVETPYTTTGLHMYYDTDDSCFYFENTDSASDLYFKGIMNFYDGIFTAGDLFVAGKITASDMDPETIQYTHTARQKVIDKYEKWACAGVPQTIEFYNIDTGFKEYYYPLLGEFRDSPSARYEVLFKLKKPLFNSDCETEYYFSSQTGKVESKIVANYDKFKLVDNIKLNKTTGELYDKTTKEILIKSEVISLKSNEK